jgi:hypothetical protein
MEKNYATLNDVNLVLKSVFNTGTIHFDWLWERFVDEEARKDEKAQQDGKAQQLLLQVIAEGMKEEGRFLNLDDIKKIYSQYHYPYKYDDIIDALKELRAEDAVETINSGEQQESINENTRCTIANDLFRQWLRQNKRLKILQPTPHPDQSEAVPSTENKSNGLYEALSVSEQGAVVSG